MKYLTKKLKRIESFGESLLWKKVLRAKKFHGLQFNRQFPVGDYIVDFICKKILLVVEVENYSHNFIYEDYKAKDNYLSKLGYSVLRVKEMDVLYNLDDIIKSLEVYVEKTKK